MLILTRKIGESLIIDDQITVSVMDVKGNQVKLGVDAPKEIRVFREEISPRGRRDKTVGSEKKKDR